MRLVFLKQFKLQASNACFVEAEPEIERNVLCTTEITNGYENTYERVPARFDFYRVWFWKIRVSIIHLYKIGLLNSYILIGTGNMSQLLYQG